MPFIPTYCRACGIHALMSQASIHGGEAVCSGCHAAAQILPGESYGESDVALFAELAVKLRGITPSYAARLGVELEGRSSAQAGRGLRQLVKLLPSLAILEFSVADQRIAMRKVEGMLATLLSSIASRGHSGSMPAIDVTPAEKDVKAR